MGREVKLVVPDLGDFSDVEVIEILVAAGDHVDVEASLVTLETDKATMDIPASHAGTVLSVNVAVGDKLNSGDVVAIIEATAEESIEKTVIIGPEEQAAILVSAEAAASAADGSGETAPLPAIQSAKAPATIAAPGTSTGDPLPETTHFAELVCRPRRLYRCISCRRSWSGRHPGRTLAGARWCLPECRLYSIEGASPRGEGYR